MADPLSHLNASVHHEDIDASSSVCAVAVEPVTGACLCVNPAESPAGCVGLSGDRGVDDCWATRGGRWWRGWGGGGNRRRGGLDRLLVAAATTTALLEQLTLG